MLKNLRVLRLGGNPIKMVSPDIGSMKQLEELTIGDDYSRTEGLVLPESFGNLQRLRVLKIENIPDLEMPRSFAQLQHLETLEMFHCTVRRTGEMIDMIRGLKNIRELTVHYCNFNM